MKLLPLLLLACAPGDGPTTPAGPTTPVAPKPSPVPSPHPTASTGTTGDTATTPGLDCASGVTYPPGAVEPMALHEVLAPYAWPEAIRHGTGEVLSIDLADVPCALPADIDWSPFDVLLFVSIPAW